MIALADRTCVVTGASSGVGRAIAAELARRGAEVVGLARRFADKPVGRLSGGQVCERWCDVTAAAAVSARFAELAGVDVLVACAGHGEFGPIADTPVAALRAMLEVHIVGTFTCVQAALPRLRPGAHIVVIGSTVTRYSFADTAAYTAAKSGQDGLARALTEELRGVDARVTRVVLGPVDTAIWDTREGFDRSRMLDPEVAAATIVDAVVRPGVGVEELVVRPVVGNL